MADLKGHCLVVRTHKRHAPTHGRARRSFKSLNRRRFPLCGRWVRRGDEPARVFASSTNAAGSSGLKLAVRKTKSQTAVWAEVAAAQVELSESLATTVYARSSPSSMELTLENKSVKKATKQYVKALTDSVGNHDDVVGVVGVVNGRVRSANIFAWHELFLQLWPKTLSALAVEAVLRGPHDPA